MLRGLDFQGGRALSVLSKAVEDYGKLSKKKYVVQSRPAPRYWRPNEPALLIVDKAVEPTKRHGQDGRLQKDGLLECRALAAGDVPVEKNLAAIREAIDAARPDAGQERIGFGVWNGQPWNPFALEWSVELFPLQAQNNLDPLARAYRDDFISANYELEEGSVELALRPGREETDKAANIYSGGSLLTPHAKLQLRQQIKSFLGQRPPLKPGEKDPVGDALREVSERLDADGFHAMAQTLNGFSEALLMRQQTLQLPVADPLGFDDAAPFTEAVRVAVGNQNRTAPQPLDDFNPLRAGLLKILDLRLVDTFGRTQSLALKDEALIATEVLTAPRAPHLISLPARLNFRWLAADGGGKAASDEPELNVHPAATPVCGWLIPNNLDGSLMVYDNAGRPLGSINQECLWAHAPGAAPVEVDGIKNAPLKTLVKHLIKQGKDFFGGFLTALEVALENIDPETFAQHEALALLTGRPIAVVRATLDLELLGRPAINQDWNVFRLDLERDLRSEENPSAEPTPRRTDGFTRVRVPVRLGEGLQLNDGLVGYWKEVWSADGQTCTYEDDLFYAHTCDTARVRKTDVGGLQVDDEQKQKLAELLRDSQGVVTRHSL